MDKELSMDELKKLSSWLEHSIFLHCSQLHMVSTYATKKDKKIKADTWIGYKLSQN